jgi:hypothetical protein
VAGISASGVQLRAEPSTRSRSVGTLQRGQIVEVLGWDDGWYHVRTKNLDGFIAGEYLTFPDSTAMAYRPSQKSEPNHAAPQPNGDRATRETHAAADTSTDSLERSRPAYSVQAGVFADPTNARLLVDSLREKGFTMVQEETVTLESGPYTRVLLGPYTTRAEADDANSELKILGVDGFVREERTQVSDAQAVTPHAADGGSATSAPTPFVARRYRESNPPAVAGAASANGAQTIPKSPARLRTGDLNTVAEGGQDIRETTDRELDSAAPRRRGGRRPVRSLLEMRRDHTVIQEWDLSCGAAALATILTYQHDDPVPEREIAKALMGREEYLAHPTLVRIRQGFSLLDLKRYVDQRGYEGVGFGRLTLEDLIERAPIMVPVNFTGYNHFVIFRGVLGDRVLLADPAWGNRTMSKRKFENAWLTYPEIGKVGFVVQRRDGATPPNQLAPHASEFVSLR